MALHSRVCAVVGGILLAATASSAAEGPSVLLLAHSPDGLPMGAALESIAAELRASGVSSLASADAASRLPGTGESLGDVRRVVGEAERAYLDLDLERAGTLLRDAVVRLDATPGPRATELLELALSREALVLLARTKTDEAGAALDRLYRLDVGHRPDPTWVSPRFAPAFEDASKRARVAESRPVRVTTAPDGAEIYIDGRAAGTGPVSIPLVSGMHRFEARLGGHRALVKSLEAGTGEIALRLEPLVDDASRDAAARETLDSEVLPGRRERFVLDLASRLGAGAALVVTARRGTPLAVDLYRPNQPAVSLDQVGADAPAATIASWVERRLKPAPIAAVRPPAVRPVKKSGTRWRLIAAGVVAVAAAGASVAYASTDAEEPARVEDRKTVRFGGVP